MTQTDLIAEFPPEHSIQDRVLLLNPRLFRSLTGKAVSGCRIFLLVLHGTLSIRIGDGEMLDIEDGQLLDLLVWEPVEFIGMSDGLAAWGLLPNYEFTNESLKDMKPAESESFKNRHSIPRLLLNEKEMLGLETHFRLFCTALSDTGHFYRTELCQSYFRCIMLEIGNLMLRKGYAGEGDGVVSRQDKIIMGFFRLVWKHYKEEHNIDFYAGRLCVSGKHLNRVVRDKLAKTPYAVIRDELVQHACYLLKNTTMPIQDISSELNFGEMSAFCKFFKKNTGSSPSDFRKSARQ